MAALYSKPHYKEARYYEVELYVGLIGLVWWLYLKHFLYVMTSLISGTNPIKWRQRPDMTIAVDWDIKHQFKQTN